MTRKVVKLKKKAAPSRQERVDGFTVQFALKIGIDNYAAMRRQIIAQWNAEQLAHVDLVVRKARALQKGNSAVVVEFKKGGKT